MPTHASALAGDPRTLERFTQAILDTADEAIVSIDGQGLIRSFNRAAEAMFGLAEADVVGQHVGRLMPRPESCRHDDHVTPYLSLSPSEIAGRGREVIGLRRDGTRFPMELSVTQFEAEGGGHHVTWLLRDVTEQSRLREELRQSQKMDAMGRLAGGVAHDFNNLLTVINGWCEALSSASPEDRESAIAQITGAAAKAANLTGQLLSFSRKSVLAPRVVDLNVVIDDIGRMLRRVIGEDIVLESALSAAPSFVRVDQGQMGQVLVNLALNARDAMPRGGKLTLCTTRKALASPDAAAFGVPPGRYVRLTVTDTGSGIADAAMPHVFEPFFTTKSERGTGLGLATVHAIVHQAGGVIRAANATGRGAEFTILLPEANEEHVAAVAPLGPAAERGTETVLVVEDEAQVRAITVSMLKNRGYNVLAACNSQEALSQAATNDHIDILVSDVVMPDLSGPELASRICSVHPEIRVLLVSGYSSDAVARQGLVGKMPSFLQKPFTGPQLAHKVREVLAMDTPTSGTVQ